MKLMCYVKPGSEMSLGIVSFEGVESRRKELYFCRSGTGFLLTINKKNLVEVKSGELYRKNRA